LKVILTDVISTPVSSFNVADISGLFSSPILEDVPGVTFEKVGPSLSTLTSSSTSSTFIY
jgi:hypothetical protein